MKLKFRNRRIEIANNNKDLITNIDGIVEYDKEIDLERLNKPVNKESKSKK